MGERLQTRPPRFRLYCLIDDGTSTCPYPPIAQIGEQEASGDWGIDVCADHAIELLVAALHDAVSLGIAQRHHARCVA